MLDILSSQPVCMLDGMSHRAIIRKHEEKMLLNKKCAVLLINRGHEVKWCVRRLPDDMM